MFDPEALAAFIAERVTKAVREELAKRDAPPEFLTLAEARALSRFGKTKMHELLRDGVLKRHGSGKSTRISRAELLAVMASMGDDSKPRVTTADVEDFAARALRRH